MTPVAATLIGEVPLNPALPTCPTGTCPVRLIAGVVPPEDEMGLVPVTLVTQVAQPIAPVEATVIGEVPLSPALPRLPMGICDTVEKQLGQEIVPMLIMGLGVATMGAVAETLPTAPAEAGSGTANAEIAAERSTGPGPVTPLMFPVMKLVTPSLQVIAQRQLHPVGTMEFTSQST
jgi:hypothetical protein